MVQTTAWMVSVVFMLFILLVFGFVALKSRERREYEPIKKKWFKARKFYATALISLMVIATIYTLRELPYDQPVYGKGIDPTIVEVSALQFGWDISQTEFKVGDPIEFHVTSPDVTHGFGIYDEDLTLVAQTQAMPEYTNEVYITFTEPGTYKILCLEYCGVGHHLMTATLEVTE